MGKSETVITKQCHFCSQLKGGGEDSFKGWFTYRYKDNKNSTEEKTVSVCPHCVNIVSLICNTLIEYREKQKDVTSVS